MEKRFEDILKLKMKNPFTANIEEALTTKYPRNG